MIDLIVVKTAVNQDFSRDCFHSVDSESCNNIHSYCFTFLYKSALHSEKQQNKLVFPITHSYKTTRKISFKTLQMMSTFNFLELLKNVTPTYRIAFSYVIIHIKYGVLIGLRCL